MKNAGFISEYDGLDNDELLSFVEWRANQLVELAEKTAQLTAERNAHIVELAERGISLRDIGRAARLSHAGVAKILNHQEARK